MTIELTPEQRKLHDAIIKRLVDEGRLIEAGFQAMRLAAIPPNAPEVQIEGMHLAYMAGAQHLFSSIMSMLEAGDEASDTDMSRMDMIAKELENFTKTLEWERFGHTSRGVN